MGQSVIFPSEAGAARAAPFFCAVAAWTNRYNRVAGRARRLNDMLSTMLYKMRAARKSLAADGRQGCNGCCERTAHACESLGCTGRHVRSLPG